MEKKMRCSFRIITDKKTRKCKKKRNDFLSKITNCNLCYCHFKKFYINEILLIQRKFRKYKLNKKVNVLKLLPYELKQIVIYFITEEERYEKYIKTLENILINKLDKFITINFMTSINMKFISDCIKFYGTDHESLYNLDKFDIIGQEILHNFYLIVKYSSILLNSDRFYDNRKYVLSYSYEFFPSIHNRFLILSKMIKFYGNRCFMNFENYNLHYSIDEMYYTFS
jgi:hypothetical protein